MKNKLWKTIKSRRFLYALLTAVLLSCSTQKQDDVKEPEKYEWQLKCYYDNNWSWTTVKCDSFQMVSKTEAYVWVDGRKTKIVAEELRPLHY
jgi:hypothetical protein